jgi:hypothetical protein
MHRNLTVWQPGKLAAERRTAQSINIHHLSAFQPMTTFFIRWANLTDGQTGMESILQSSGVMSQCLFHSESSKLMVLNDEIRFLDSNNFSRISLLLPSTLAEIILRSGS